MAYDDVLAERVRKFLRRRKGVTERKMFGALVFMLRGHMVCGILDNELIVRLGPEVAPLALHEPHTRVMDFTGKPMKTMICVATEGTAASDQLRHWMHLAIDYVRSLPPKVA